MRTARFRQYVLTAIPEGKANAVLSFMPEMLKSDESEGDDTLPVNTPAIVEWNPPLSQASSRPRPPQAGFSAERQPARYRGKVILLTSTVNMDWTSWPGSPSYGAMMHELTRLAVSGRLREQSQTVGNMLEAYLPGGVEVDVTVNSRQGIAIDRRQGEHADDRGRQPVSLVRNRFRRHLSRRNVRATIEIPFAVNVPINSADQKGSESDLTRSMRTA